MIKPLASNVLRWSGVAVALLLVPVSPSSADDVLPGPIPATAERVVDGDTIEVVATIWPGLATHARIRLASIDTPEMNSPCPAARAKALQARTIVEAAVKDVGLHLVHVRPEHAYGRILADIQLADGRDLGALLLSAGLAKPYAKRVRCDWCAQAPRCELARN
jgi:endonuclease YncB( thermonuclease family)